MKHTSIIILSIILIVLSSVLVIASDNGQGCENEHACGATLSSAAGFGAVELCGTCAVCGADDGICPEDFYSGGLQGSCASCPDPDCTATMTGQVFYGNTGMPISNAEIKAKYPGDTTFKKIGETTTEGKYLEYPRTANPIEIYATYTDSNGATEDVYNSKISDISLSRGEEKQINFTLWPAKCLSDCTREGNSICDATCNNQNGCVFAHNEKYSSNDTKIKLNEHKIGEKVSLDSVTECNGTNTITEDIATTCTGPITEKVSYLPTGACGDGNQTQFSTVTPSDNNKENLITRTARVYTEDGNVAILTIVYWEGEEGK